MRQRDQRAARSPSASASFLRESTPTSWALSATQDLAVPAELSRFMATRADAHLVEVDASHAVTVSQPGVVADVILEAAEKTAR